MKLSQTFPTCMFLLLRGGGGVGSGRTALVRALASDSASSFSRRPRSAVDGDSASAARFSSLSATAPSSVGQRGTPTSPATTRLFSTIEKELTTTASTMVDANGEPYPTEMTEDERYLFDLNGYIIIRGVLTEDEVRRANEAIDNHAHEFVERGEGALRNAVEGTKMYGSGPGRKDLGGCLEWGEIESRVFQSILAHPRLLPVFNGILGEGYRMDHLPMVLAQDKGAEGFRLHGGTIDCSSGEYNPYLAYTCQHGTLRSALLGCNVLLADHSAGYGGFCVVPGSHKSNFKMPAGMVDGERYAEYIQQPVTKAGDVILFSEGTVHGALPWTADTQRRACLYRFSPSTNVYGRSYFGHEGGGWPTKMYEGLSEAERAVLEPPYANRLDRPTVRDDGSVEVQSRGERKKLHDQQVFGTKYF